MSRSERDDPEWDEFDRALLSSAALDLPERGALERATRALGAATLASAALVGTSTSLGASGAVAGPTLVGVSLAALGKAVLVGAVVGAGFVGVVHRAAAPDPHPAHVAGPPRAVSGGPAPPAGARAVALTPERPPDMASLDEPALERRVRDPSKASARPQPALVHSPSPASSAASATSLAIEIDLLDRARAALSRKDASLALRELDRYAAQGGGHSLAREASLLRIEALRALGDAARAADIAQRLVEEDPGGLTGLRARELMR